MSRFIEYVAYRLSERNRQKKFKLFLTLLSPKKDDTVLDVGVNDEEYSESDNYLEKHYPFPEQITAVSQESLDHFKKRYPHIRALIANGQSLPFHDNEFSVSHSNAVIEHVGTRINQLAFLKELFRVGQKGFLTTPNKYFPVEVHTRVPFLHILLPKSFFDMFLKKIGKEWAVGQYMHLLSIRDIRSLLNDAGISQYKIIRNRIFGFTATFTVVWSKETKYTLL